MNFSRGRVAGSRSLSGQAAVPGPTADCGPPAESAPLVASGLPAASDPPAALGCQTHRFTPQVANRFSDVKSVLLSVGSGLGISILPAEVAAIVASLPETRIQVTPIDDENYAITCAVAWKKSLLNPAAELFLKVMEEQLG